MSRVGVHVDEQGRPTTPAHEAQRRVEEAKPAPPAARGGPRDDGRRLPSTGSEESAPGVIVNGHRDAATGRMVPRPHPFAGIGHEIAVADTGNAEMARAFNRAPLPGRGSPTPGQAPAGRRSRDGLGTQRAPGE